jgi:hypothetical protein
MKELIDHRIRFLAEFTLNTVMGSKWQLVQRLFSAAQGPVESAGRLQCS